MDLDYQLLKSALDAMPQAVMIADQAGEVIYRNSAGAEMSGLSDVCEILGLDWQDIDTGREHTTHNVEIAIDDERQLVADVWTGPINVPHRAVLVIVTDTSLRTSMAMRLAADERTEALGGLAARVAHELNNPLDGVLRYVGLAQRVAGPQAAGYLASARDGLERMARIGRDLVDQARPGGGFGENLSQIIDQAVSAMQPRADALGVRIAREGVTEAVGPRNLFQVFCNIIKNALDAMSNSGDKKLSIAMRNEGDSCVITFTDTGQGLTPNDAHQAFDPFFTTKAQGDGVGLGLAVSREIISRADGTIDIAPSATGGAEVTIQLPAGEMTAAKAQPTARSV